MGNTQSTRVVGYVRVSTEGQAEEGVSIAAQRAKLQAYCVAFGLTLVGIEADEGLSAKSLARPGLQRALARLESGEASALLVCKLDRLTRSVVDLGTLVERVFSRPGGPALVSLAESVDTRSAAGRLVLHVLGAVAAWEREACAERTREALAHLRAEGVQLGGEALGWRRGEATDPAGRRVLEAVAEEAATVARALELRAEGKTLRAVAETLEAEGRATKSGGRWHANTVRRIVARASRGAE